MAKVKLGLRSSDFNKNLILLALPQPNEIYDDSKMIVFTWKDLSEDSIVILKQIYKDNRDCEFINIDYKE